VRIVNELAPGVIASGAAPQTVLTPRLPPTPRRLTLRRRLKTIACWLLRRRRAAAAFEPLDAAARRDLGVTAGWNATEAAARIATARREIELNYLLSASSRFVVRNVDAGL
jgi:hypothetical protein